MNASQRSVAVCLSIMLLFCGCFGSDNPLSDPAHAKLDKEFNGRWMMPPEKPTDGEYLWDVSAAGKGFPAGMHKLVITENGEQKTALSFVTKIGDRSYMNFVQLKNDKVPAKWDPSVVEGYILIGYRIRKDELDLIPLDEEFILSSIQKGEIKGRKIGKNRGETVLSSTTKELKAFFEKHGKKISSGEPEVMKRKK